MNERGTAAKTKSTKSDTPALKTGKTDRKTKHGNSNVSMKHGMKKGSAGKGNWGVAGDEGEESDSRAALDCVLIVERLNAHM